MDAVLSTLEVAYAKAFEDAAGVGAHAGFAERDAAPHRPARRAGPRRARGPGSGRDGPLRRGAATGPAGRRRRHGAADRAGPAPVAQRPDRPGRCTIAPDGRHGRAGPTDPAGRHPRRALRSPRGRRDAVGRHPGSLRCVADPPRRSGDAAEPRRRPGRGGRAGGRTGGGRGPCRADGGALVALADRTGAPAGHARPHGRGQGGLRRGARCSTPRPPNGSISRVAGASVA